MICDRDKSLAVLLAVSIGLVALSGNVLRVSSVCILDT